MANSDILVQSSLQSVQNKLETTQQGAAKAVVTNNPVSSQVSTEDVVANSSQAKLKTQQQDQRQTLHGKVADLNQHMQHFNRNIQFSIDDESGDTVIKVVDSDTGKLIRQIPSQEVLDVHSAIEKYQGVLLETKA